ncbi:MAG: hypothetical protein AAB502_01375 [Chloroflexota bacterium]
MTQKKVVLLNPTVPLKNAALGALAPRPSALRGKKVGVLWNEKPNGDILLGRLAERLNQTFEFSGRLSRTKHPAARASNEILNELAESCDIVINGIGD